MRLSMQGLNVILSRSNLSVLYFITTERKNIFNSLVLQYIIVTSLKFIETPNVPNTNVPELRRGASVIVTARRVTQHIGS